MQGKMERPTNHRSWLRTSSEAGRLRNGQAFAAFCTSLTAALLLASSLVQRSVYVALTDETRVRLPGGEDSFSPFFPLLFFSLLDSGAPARRTVRRTSIGRNPAFLARPPACTLRRTHRCIAYVSTIVPENGRPSLRLLPRIAQRPQLLCAITRGSNCMRQRWTLGEDARRPPRA